MRRIHRAIPLLFFFVAASCGNAQVTTHTSETVRAGVSPSSSVSSKPSTVLLAVTPGQPPQPPTTVQLYKEDGTPAGAISLPANVRQVAAAGNQIFASTGDGTLYGIKPDGSRQVLDQLGANAGSFLLSRDGRQWAWTTQVVDQNTSIHLGGIQGGDRVVATVTFPQVLGLFSWTSSGIYLESFPLDYFGYVPFPNAWAAFGGLRKLNVSDGTLQSLAQFTKCLFSDEAVDSTIACFPTRQGYLVPVLHSLRLIRPDGSSVDLSLATPRFNYVGDAYFSPDGSLLTVAGATGVGNNTPAGGNTSNPQPEQFGTDMVHVADASIVRFGPGGVRPAMGPQSWLPDGDIVLWRPVGAAGGQPGFYVVDRTGTVVGNEIPIDGSAVGYLTE